MADHTDWPLLLSQTTADETSILDLLQAGGLIGYAIIALSVVALALMIMHFVQIRAHNLTPPDLVDALDEMLVRGDVDEALRFCKDPANGCFLTRVLDAGLTRFQRSAFGAFELRSALEETGQEQAAKLYRSTDGLGLIVGIAPLMGLLGTVVGMVGAFKTISSVEGFARPDQLAGDISQALVTTVMGLSLAIPSLAAFTFFRNRIDALVVEAAATVEQLTLPLEMSRQKQQARPAASPKPPAG